MDVHAIVFITSERAHTTEDIPRLMIDHEIVAWQSGHHADVYRLCVNREVAERLLAIDMRFSETGHRSTRRAFWRKVDFHGTKEELLKAIRARYPKVRAFHEEFGPAMARQSIGKA